MQINTPIERKNKATKIIKTAAKPASIVYRISTAAPTSTNNNTSAASHNLPNFSDKRFDTNSVLFNLITHAMLTTANKPETETIPFNQVSIAINKNETPSTIITFILFRT